MAHIHELPPVEIEDTLLEATEAQAFGMGGIIVRTPNDPGFCYKIPNSSAVEEALDGLTRETQVHAVLEELGIPTIPTFELRSVTVTRDGNQLTLPCTRMTDLAADGSLVISTPDTFHAMMNAGIPADEYFGQLHSGRPIYNAPEFFDQLGQIVARASSAAGTIAGTEVTQLRINNRGFFFVAHPNGNLETCIGDFHDGVELNAPEDILAESFVRSEATAAEDFYYTEVCMYLRMVVKIFPQIQKQAETFTTATFSGRPFVL